MGWWGRRSPLLSLWLGVLRAPPLSVESLNAGLYLTGGNTEVTLYILEFRVGAGLKWSRKEVKEGEDAVWKPPTAAPRGSAEWKIGSDMS